ncbi:MAG: hypothetical protein IPJ11_08745 [Gemmatimonadetes bacterium]|nr:hypothetical protein [Gemmatimonadota bacterium]
MHVSMPQPTPELVERFYDQVSRTWPLPRSPFATPVGVYSICEAANQLGTLGCILFAATEPFLARYPESLRREIENLLFSIPGHDTPTPEATLALVWSWLLGVKGWAEAGHVADEAILEIPQRYRQIRLAFATGLLEAIPPQHAPPRDVRRSKPRIRR